MIIFGTTTIRRTVNQGDFYCPQCGSSQPFRHRKPTLFITLYFIPVIPVGSGGDEYVECRNCQAAYSPEAVDLSERDYYAAYVNDLKWVMVMMACQNQAVPEEERRHLQDALHRETGELWDTVELDEQLEKGFELSQEGEFLQYIGYLCGDMNLDAKRQAVRCAFEAAMASGELSPSRAAALKQVPEALQLTEAQFRDAIEEIA